MRIAQLVVAFAILAFAIGALADDAAMCRFSWAYGGSTCWAGGRLYQQQDTGACIKTGPNRSYYKTCAQDTGSYVMSYMTNYFNTSDCTGNFTSTVRKILNSHGFDLLTAIFWVYFVRECSLYKFPFRAQMD